jgi:hypothetical protein
VLESNKGANLMIRVLEVATTLMIKPSGENQYLIWFGKKPKNWAGRCNLSKAAKSSRLSCPWPMNEQMMNDEEIKTKIVDIIYRHTGRLPGLCKKP